MKGGKGKKQSSQPNQKKAAGSPAKPQQSPSKPAQGAKGPVSPPLDFQSSLAQSLKTVATNEPVSVVQPRSSVPSLSEDIQHLDLETYHIDVSKVNVLRNPSAPILYEEALKYETGTTISDHGALCCSSGERTGRSPKDKRIVKDSNTEGIWWGKVNIEMDEHTFMVNRERAVDYLSTRPRIYVIDAFAGWVPQYRLKVRVICARAYHALFMKNMLIRPTEEELKNFGKPDFTIFNSGQFPANRYTHGMTSSCSVSINFTLNEMVILGTQYAGEMKKGIFSVMHYYMPKRGILSLHSSANVGKSGDVSIFFGLSGTGKTTLSADPQRGLIGDDETCWYDDGVFNIEGGCYAKCIGLSREQEPEIYDAVRFGSVLENVVFDPISRVVDYNDDSITQNTRVSYPIEFIPNAVIPCVAGQPKNIIMLTCDAFGVLPPVSKLTPEQAMYYFISGYTAKVAGTEVGIVEPEATFSACFGDAFLVWHPTKYAEMLAEKIKTHTADVWLVSTGWSGGGYGVGSRMKLKYTRAIIDAIHNGELSKVSYSNLPIFNLAIPNTCSNVPTEILNPRNTWKKPEDYDAKLSQLSQLFIKNFSQYSDAKSKSIAQSGGPKA